MNCADRSERQHSSDWEHLGRAAERFARRVARDASRFAERIQEHASEFARDTARDWRRMCWSFEHGGRPRGEAGDVRRIFEDVRGVLSDIVDGIDEFLDRVFADAGDTGWLRMVSNRAASCGHCGRAIGAGEECFVRRRAGEKELRCLSCGAPPEDKPASS
jgi:hypothetical protein